MVAGGVEVSASAPEHSKVRVSLCISGPLASNPNRVANFEGLWLLGLLLCIRGCLSRRDGRGVGGSAPAKIRSR